MGENIEKKADEPSIRSNWTIEEVKLFFETRINSDIGPVTGPFTYTNGKNERVDYKYVTFEKSDS